MSAIAFVAVGVALAPVALYALLVLGVAVAYARLSLYGQGAASLGLIVREAWAQLRIIGWTLMRRGRRMKGEAGAGPPVVLIHGLAADGTSMWAYRRALADLGRPTLAPHLGGIFRPIEKYALRLTTALDRLLAAHPGEGVDVVCHSMGGIVLRACLGVRPDLQPRIRRVVTVASPHTGTAAARGMFFPEAKQLLVGAKWIDGLPPLPKLLPNARLVTIASDADAVVYPNATCSFEGAEHHALHGVGHAELLVKPDVVDLVVQALS